MRELLARLDERTERLDRDIRQMLNGQQAQYELLENKLMANIHDLKHSMRSTEVIVALNQRKSEANETLVKKHDDWFSWSVRIVLLSVFGAVLVSAGLGGF